MCVCVCVCVFVVLLIIWKLDKFAFQIRNRNIRSFYISDQREKSLQLEKCVKMKKEKTNFLGKKCRKQIIARSSFRKMIDIILFCDWEEFFKGWLKNCSKCSLGSNSLGQSQGFVEKLISWKATRNILWVVKRGFFFSRYLWSFFFFLYLFFFFFVAVKNASSRNTFWRKLNFFGYQKSTSFRNIFWSK